VRLLLVGGLPGTGKSTIAGALADRIGAVLLRTDRIRRELPSAAGLSGAAGYGRGLYESGPVHDTYREMLDRARTLIEHGESVVLDASWSDPDERRSARHLAQDSLASLVELRCEAPLDVTKQRIADRAGDESDATEEVAVRMAENFGAWPESTTVDTSGRVEDAVTAAVESVEAQRRRQVGGAAS
jgi:uncharacterized protein